MSSINQEGGCPHALSECTSQAMKAQGWDKITHTGLHGQLGVSWDL